MSWTRNAWGDVGEALYDVTDVELAGLIARLHDLASTQPGRVAEVLRGFAAMAETERQHRIDEAQRKWREALAAKAADQRRQRVTGRSTRRATKVASYTPGMTRRQPRRDGQR